MHESEYVYQHWFPCIRIWPLITQSTWCSEKETNILLLLKICNTVFLNSIDIFEENA